LHNRRDDGEEDEEEAEENKSTAAASGASNLDVSGFLVLVRELDADALGLIFERDESQRSEGE
jgi:hypothetical protein